MHLQVISRWQSKTWMASTLKSHYKQPLCIIYGAAILGVALDDTAAIYKSTEEILWIKIPARKIETYKFELLKEYPINSD